MSGIRITAGSLKGRKIELPPGPVRPTSSRAREAVFNILSDKIPGSRFLDLFAGSGIMALEAISRGASAAVAVEISGKAVSVISDMASRLGISLTARRSDAIRFLAGKERLQPFDIVYADPPYDYAEYDRLLESLDKSPLLRTDGIVAIEHRKKRKLETGAELARLVHREGRSWGQVTVEFFDVLEA